MLIQLEIKNFAIIEHSIINFDKGFNVLSGETGAGKSILFDAISSILGERTSKQSVRKDQDKAELKAVFLKTKKIEKIMKEKDINNEDDYFVVERIINKNGRSVAKLNGSIQTTQTIRDLCLHSVEICGQREHQELLKDENYLSFIDQNADEEQKSVLNNYKELYSEWKEVNKKLQTINSDEREKEQLLDLYRFQKEEIEMAQLSPNEDENLIEEKQLLSGFEKISHNLQKSLKSLEATDYIYEAKTELSSVSKFDKRIEILSDRLEKVYHELEDIKDEANDYINNVEYDESRLNEIMMRLEDINKLKRKYADTIEGILDHHQIITGKINNFENKEERTKELEQEKSRLELKMNALSNTLHNNRVKLGDKSQKAIITQIKELYMPDASLIFKFEKTDEFNASGKTKVSLLFNANKGEDLQPLSKVASGGELSRVLLAMKIADQENEKIPTVLFDEVDEGVGGEVGRIIGKKLEELGSNVQVICISHLPQVASRANHHFLIKKETKGERTISSIKKLGDKERKEEIARMIFGDEKNDVTIRQAEEMLKKES